MSKDKEPKKLTPSTTMIIILIIGVISFIILRLTYDMGYGHGRLLGRGEKKCVCGAVYTNQFGYWTETGGDCSNKLPTKCND